MRPTISARCQPALPPTSMGRCWWWDCYLQPAVPVPLLPAAPAGEPAAVPVPLLPAAPAGEPAAAPAPGPPELAPASLAAAALPPDCNSARRSSPGHGAKLVPRARPYRPAHQVESALVSPLGVCAKTGVEASVSTTRTLSHFFIATASSAPLAMHGTVRAMVMPMIGERSLEHGELRSLELVATTTRH
jgi:hypothetical protein